jgi:acyl-CoA synthetase (AMP-forming)/AMP-acid ligase II
LTYAICRAPPTQNWGTFYDIRRFGGLQIFLRTLAGTGNLTLTSPREPLENFLTRLASAGTTHISGTPSQWRLALLCGAASTISPNYVRLSGEIADQPILDALRAAFPQASIVHAFASTEAGVAFEVQDGLTGFPVSRVDRSREPSFTVVEGILRIRSEGTASRYLGERPPQLRDADGYVDTGDIVERRGDRYEFLGRDGGIINVGGAKVHPEEVEAVINSHTNVRASRVFGHKNRLIGELVAAEVVLRESSNNVRITKEIRDLCHANLAAYKVPFWINVVDSLSITPSGKLRRNQ